MSKREVNEQDLKSGCCVSFKPEDITVGACHIFRLGNMKIAVCKEKDGTIKIFVVEKEH